MAMDCGSSHLSNQSLEVLLQTKEKIESVLSKYNHLFETLNNISVEIEEDKRKKNSIIPINSALLFSSQISRTIFSPDGWKEGFPLIHGLPPSPQPEHMRIGKLSQYNEEHQNFDSKILNLNQSTDSVSIKVSGINEVERKEAEVNSILKKYFKLSEKLKRNEQEKLVQEEEQRRKIELEAQVTLKSSEMEKMNEEEEEEEEEMEVVEEEIVKETIQAKERKTVAVSFFSYDDDDEEEDEY